MATQISVYNQAVLELGESRLSSISETRESRYNLDTVWSPVLAFMLEAGFWKFAMRSVQIDADASITPAFGLTNAFNFPTDWVRTYQVSANEFYQPPLEDWIEESNQFWSDIDPMFVRYVSNSDTGYGMDLDRWTARFEKAVVLQLAARICPKTTGSSDSLKERLTKSADEALNLALSFEALREPPKRPQQGRWNSARVGRHGGRSDWHRYS